MICTNKNIIEYKNIKANNFIFTDYIFNNTRGNIKFYKETDESPINGITVSINTNLSSDYVYYTENNVNYCDLTATCNSTHAYSLLSFRLLTTNSSPIPIISATINDEEIQFNTTVDDNISFITFFIPKNEKYVITLKLQVSSNNKDISVKRLFNF